jgi:hypothetical protein
MTGLQPASTGNPVRDGRPGSGPWSYELGTKIRVDQDSRLIGIRYWRDAGETGTHIGRLWSASGTQLAQVTFSGESGSGWQRADFADPVTLQAGTTYVVSVGINAAFVTTTSGLANELVSGPLHSVADGANGVFAGAAGQFPTSSWRSSNYFVDAVVGSGSAAPHTPSVTGTTPASGATGVSPGTAVTATFSTALDATTVSGQSFTLADAGGTAVAAHVTYDASAHQARLVPDAPLAESTTYTAQLTTAIHADDGTPLPDAVSWSFTTAAAGPPTVTAVSPVDGATQVSTSATVRATFSTAMDGASIDGSSFALSGPAGAVAATVSYDAASRTATLTPTGGLAGSTTYTATVGTGARSSGGTALADPVSWSFTTSGCPCRLYADGDAPAGTGFPTQDGRSGAGPWSYELGTKIRVSGPAQLTAIRFYKSPGETGSHTGRLWTASGTQVASVAFSGESASGWQEAQLATPVDLTPGVTYVVSVNANAFFVSTQFGLQSARSSGPLSSVADGANGVFGSAAGVFPTGSWRSSSYFVDAVVR